MAHRAAGAGAIFGTGVAAFVLVVDPAVQGWADGSSAATLDGGGSASAGFL